MGFNLFWIVAGALQLEAIIYWPRALPHPVMWVGRFISALERRWNKPVFSERHKKLLGILTVLLLVLVAVFAGLGIHWVATVLPWPLGMAVLVMACVCGLALGSLWQHVRAIQRPLSDRRLTAARNAVGMIVGRDTASMDETDIATAAIESLAESFNDGVVAPVFWFVVAGLPGLIAYKAVNTADSMIGHMEPRWRAFGWAAAKTDDVMNLIPARLAGALLALAGLATGSATKGWRIMFRDARKHASPNAGWTEAAMAGVLGVRLGGTVRYDGLENARPVLGEGPVPMASDLKRAMSVYLWACLGLFVIVLGGGFLWPQ
ncbi:adenosylcobinamide-phosphate synthase CbiB [Brevundimonas sp.]|uniref:adenosylcobinamide-phosphate synthase CbiB n=1 Tax=Brevundimonas sp. TaxID=1871086 RepID=UPI002FC6EB87